MLIFPFWVLSARKQNNDSANARGVRAFALYNKFHERTQGKQNVSEHDQEIPSMFSNFAGSLFPIFRLLSTQCLSYTVN